MSERQNQIARLDFSMTIPAASAGAGFQLWKNVCNGRGFGIVPLQTAWVAQRNLLDECGIDAFTSDRYWRMAENDFRSG